MKFKVYEGGLYGTLTENELDHLKTMIDYFNSTSPILETYNKLEVEIRDDNLIFFYDNLLEELEEFKAQGHAYVNADMWSTDKIDFDFYPDKQLPLDETIADIKNRLKKLRPYD